MYISNDEPPSFRGKKLVETDHFHRELYDAYGKGLDFALELLEEGIHERESREKVRVTKRTSGGFWELVYAEFEGEIFLKQEMIMERCPFCKSKVSRYSETKEGVEMHGWKCAKCNESFFPGSEMVRWEVLTGRRKDMVRKIRTVGNSKVVTLPEKLIAEAKIHANDLVLFEKLKEGLLLRIIHPHLPRRS